MNRTSRREILKGGARLAGLLALTPALAGRADAQPGCVEEASEPLRTALNYADPAPQPARPCKACGFFKAEAGTSCGRCDIMTGPVSATAWCESWSPPK